MTETKRDLQADLELCECATLGPWKFFENSRIIVNKTDFWICTVERNNDKQFIAEAREGWPYAIRRALEAEARVAELEAENERLREQLRDMNEYKRLAEWGLRKVFGEERVVRHDI